MVGKRVMVVAVLLAASWCAGAVEPAQDVQIRDRYLATALKNPRHGPAVERLYQLAVQTDGVDALIAQIEADAAASPVAAASIVGLLQEMRGRDVEAIDAYRKAAEADAHAYYPRYAMAQLLLHRNRYEPAIAALQEALAAEPPPADAIEIRKTLGRAYLRSRQMDQARQTWTALAQMAPDDPITLQELIALLEDEEQWDEALIYYERLRELQKDRPYQAVLCTIAMGRVEARRGRFTEALARYDEALARTEPDSWLADEIRTRVQELFRKRNDLSGLADYYRKRLESDARDVRTMVALAQLLVEQNQQSDARTWYTKALDLAPKDQAVRLAYVRLLELVKDYPAAVREYETLLEQNPAQAAYLEALGELHAEYGQEAGVQKAREAWRRIADLNPKDPATMVQVAEIFRRHQMRDDAAEFYRKAIDLAPEVAQYREYYGEFFVKGDQRDEALAVFQEMAAGSRESVQTVMRLADVLGYFGYDAESLAAARRGVEIAPDSFEARMLLVKRLSADSGQIDEALAELDRAAPLAPNEFFADQVVETRIRLLTRAEKLADQYDRRAQALAEQPVDQPAPYVEVARMALALGRIEPAAEWVGRALEKAPDSVSVLELAATTYGRAGDYAQREAIYKRLIERAPQNRGQYYRQLALHYAQIGDVEASLQSAEQVITAGPDNPEAYQLLADLCTRFGLPDRSLEVLKKALKVDPRNVELRLAYARHLERDGQIELALEEYWQVYDVQDDVSDKLATMRLLADAAYRAGSFEQLLDRLQRRQRLTRDEWVPALSMAEACRQIGDFSKAREILTGLLAQRPADADLLGQVVRLAVSEGLKGEAVRHLRQLVKLEPSRQHHMQLAELLHDTDQTDEALAVWKQAAELGDDRADSLIMVVREMLSRKLHEPAIQLLAEQYQLRPDDWQLGYGYGLVLLGAERLDEAAKVFLAVADLPDPVQSEQPKKTGSQQPQMPSWYATYQSQLPPEIRRLQTMMTLRYQLQPRRYGYYGGPGQAQSVFMPPDLDTARMAAWFQYCQIARQQDRFDALVRQLEEASTRQSLWRLVQARAMDEAARKELADAADRLCKVAPTDAAARLLRVRTLLDFARGPQAEQIPYEQAREAIDEAVELVPSMAWEIQTNWAYFLKQTGRTEELEAFCRQIAERPVTNLMEASMAVSALAAVEDLDGALAAMQRLQEKYAAGQQSLGIGSQYTNVSLAQLAMKKDRPELAAQLMLAFLNQSRPRSTTAVGRQPLYAQYAGGQVAVESFPSATAYYDQIRLQALEQFYRAAFGIMPGASAARRPGSSLVPTTQPAESQPASQPVDPPAVLALRQALEKDLSSENEDDRVYAHLALAYLDWWTDRKEAAAKHLAGAVELRPWDASLCMDLARLRYNLDDRKGAMEALARINRRYHALYKPAQQLLLKAASEAGEKDLAQQAALRLFSMQLAPSEQLELAAVLRDLSLTAKAEQLEQRVTAVSPNDVDQIYRLLRQARERGDKAQAAQLARQVLRNADKAPSNQDHYRSYALDSLRESGELDQAIAEAEKQREANPNAVRVLMDLWHYYAAKGDFAKAAEAAEQALAQRPEDTGMRYQYAVALLERGQHARAVEQLKTVCAKDPAVMLGQDIWRTIDQFERSGRIDELLTLLLEMNWDRLSTGSHAMQPWQISQNLVQAVSRVSWRLGSQPAWLSGFEDTGERIELSEQLMPAAQLYRRRFAPGKVTIGQASQNTRNYFVLIVPTEQTAPSPKATAPGIADGATGVSVQSQLTWSAPADATGFRLHLGTQDPPPFLQEVTGRSLALDGQTLKPGTKYYWRVDVVTPGGTVAGDVWSFTTSTAPADPPRRSAIRLDTRKGASQIEQVQEFHTCMTAATTMEGLECRTLATGFDSYFTFRLSQAYVRAQSPEQHITIDYYDAEAGWVDVQYPTAAQPRTSAGKIELTGSQTWKRHTWRVTHAAFDPDDPAKREIRVVPEKGKPFYLRQVQVSPQPPTADPVPVIVADAIDGIAPLTARLYAAASFCPDDGRIAQYAWDLGDGRTHAGPQTEITFPTAGVYTVALTVTDDAGRRATSTVDITAQATAAPIRNLSRYALTTLSPGDTPFEDRGSRIQEMPKHLVGSIGIRTRHDHYVGNQDEWLTFDLDTEADVYVAYDAATTGSRTLLAYLDKLNDFLVNDPQMEWQYGEVVAARAKALLGAGREWEAFRYMLACSDVFADYQPARPATVLEQEHTRPLGVKTRRADLMRGGWSLPEGNLIAQTFDQLMAVVEKTHQYEPMREHLAQCLAKDLKNSRTALWLAVFDLRLGHHDMVRAAVPKLLAEYESQADAYNGPVSQTSLALLAQEMAKVPELLPLAVQCDEAIVRKAETLPGGGNQSYLAMRLANRYIQAGRKDLAAAIMTRLSRMPVDSRQGIHGIYQKQQEMYYAAELLSKAGMHREAYELLVDAEKLDTSGAVARGISDYLGRQIKQLMTSIAASHPQVKAPATQPQEAGPAQAAGPTTQQAAQAAVAPAAQPVALTPAVATQPVVQTVAAASPPPIEGAALVLQNGRDGYEGCIDASIRRTTGVSPNGGAEAELMMFGYPEDVQRIVIRYDLSGLAAGAKVLAARLMLFNREGHARQGDYLAYELTTAWTEDGVTWQNAAADTHWAQLGGDYVPLVVGRYTKTSQQKDNWHVFDVTEAVRHWLEDPQSNHGLLIRPENEAGTFGNKYRSSEYAEVNQRPILAIWLEEAPADLRASGK